MGSSLGELAQDTGQRGEQSHDSLAVCISGVWFVSQQGQWNHIDREPPD